MIYKTILVHADAYSHAKDRYRLAATLAVEENAHLVGLASASTAGRLRRMVALSAEGADIETYAEQLVEQAEDILAQYEAIARHAGVSSLESRIAREEAAIALGIHARYADLTIVSRTPAQEDCIAVDERFLELVAMQAGAPLLVLPPEATVPRVGERVLIGWNAGREARRALYFSLPLLQRARSVHVAVLNPKARPGLHGPEPGADIATFLARHGIHVEVIQESTKNPEGDALLDIAADLHTELLVIGCSGHSRFREILLGGVTHTVLRAATLPVLMAH